MSKPDEKIAQIVLPTYVDDYIEQFRSFILRNDSWQGRSEAREALRNAIRRLVYDERQLAVKNLTERTNELQEGCDEAREAVRTFLNAEFNGDWWSGKTWNELFGGLARASKNREEWNAQHSWDLKVARDKIQELEEELVKVKAEFAHEFAKDDPKGFSRPWCGGDTWGTMEESHKPTATGGCARCAFTWERTVETDLKVGIVVPPAIEKAGMAPKCVKITSIKLSARDEAGLRVPHIPSPPACDVCNKCGGDVKSGHQRFCPELAKSWRDRGCTCFNMTYCTCEEENDDGM